MAAIDDLIVETLELLYGTGRIERPTEDTLDGAINDSVTTAVFDTPALWRRDDFAEINSEVLICAGDHAANVTVRRAQRGTTAASHSDADVVRRNPQFTRRKVTATINEVANTDLWPYVWSPENATITWSDNDYIYDLPAKYGGVVEVYQSYDNKIKPLHSGWWDTKLTTHTDVASTAQALRISQVHDTSETVYYTAKIRPSSSTLDNLDQKVLDLIPWKAAAKLILTRVGAERAAGGRARSGQGSPHGDYAAWEVEFRNARDKLASQLRIDYPTAPRFRSTTPRVF